MLNYGCLIQHRHCFHPLPSFALHFHLQQEMSEVKMTQWKCRPVEVIDLLRDFRYLCSLVYNVYTRQ